MKISLNWIKQFTEIDVSTNELVKLATERLGGIERVIDYSKHYEGVVVARVVSCIKHPNADKLSLCKVDDGGVVKDVERDENGYVQVVCGAPNVREGLLVAWIPPKAIVPASYGDKELFVLEARDLRGQMSNGMLASASELGLNDDHSGILEIEEAVKLGTPFKNLYDLDDVIIEIENKMFTHRPDGFGHLGVAREIAGIQHKAFASPEWYLHPQLPSGENNVAVSIEDPDLSPRYMAVEFKNVKVKPSPLWLQSHLKRVGVRPINNIVDITNYIMMLTAQPVHAFDFDKIAVDDKAEISVRRPKAGEKMLLLDGREITPHEDATLICNANGAIALGGVMGGGNSEIDENTTHVVLECATFNMYNVRKTSMVHGLFTDAATRLTKGQPAEQLPSVLAKAIEMFEELADATTVGGPVDAYPLKKEDAPYIEVEAKFINDRLGSKFSSEEIVALLTNVEITAHEASGPISVSAPFWRTDLEIPEDIVEEVGRLYGFNQLQVILPKRSIAPATPEPLRFLKTEIRASLSRAGANEVLTYSFVHGDLLKKADQNPEKAFKLRNALSPDLQYYRLSLLPSLLDKVHPNIKLGFNEFTLFEIGKTHCKFNDDQSGTVPDEYNNLELVYSSKKPKNGAAYYQMLRQVDALLRSLGIPYRLDRPEVGVEVQSEKPYDLTRSAYIYYKHAEQGGLIGIVGELKSSVINAFKLPEYTAGATLLLDGASFYKENRQLSAYKPLSRFPATEQDITLKVKADISYADLYNVIEHRLKNSEYEYELQPISIYQALPAAKNVDDPQQSTEKLSKENTKNITFRITLTHYDRTLTTHEVNKLVESITWQAKQTLNAEQV